MTSRELILRRLGHTLSEPQLVQLNQVLRQSAPEGEPLSSWVDTLSRLDLRDASWVKILAVVLIPKTEFFRHPAQLLALRRHLKCGEDERVGGPRVWSAACATGEEAYSLASCLPGATVVASDLGLAHLEVAARGRYPRQRLESIPLEFRDSFERSGKGVAVSLALRDRVRFEWGDLTDPKSYPRRPPGGWDAIFCRNALFYFEAERRASILRSLAEELGEDGLLFLGPAEQVTRIEELVLCDLGDGVYAYRRGRDPGPTELSGSSSQTSASTATRPGRGETWQFAPVSATTLESGPQAEPQLTAEELVREALALERSDRAAARDLLEAANRAADLDSAAHWTIGRAYRSLGELERAVESLRRALLLAPGLWGAAFQLAGALFDLGQHAEALAEYERTRRLIKESPEDELVGPDADGVCRRQIARCREKLGAD